jgi:tetratricopeptide (TPR) repeat protein
MPEQAIAHTKKAMQLCPVYPAWYPYGVATCYWMMKQYEQALVAVEEAIRIDPGFSLSFMVLAMILVETGQVDEARTAIRSLLAIDPDFRFSAFAAGVPFLDEAVEARRRDAVLSAGLPE